MIVRRPASRATVANPRQPAGCLLSSIAMDRSAQLPEGVAWRDPERARRNLAALEPHLPPGGEIQLNLFLRQMPDPDSALNYLERYIVSGGYPARDLFRPSRCLHAALAIFSHSQALADTLFRHPELLNWALDEERLYRVLSNEEMYIDLGSSRTSEDDAHVAHTLSRFKRMHLLRIALRDLLGLATLAEVTLELSNLADAILHGAQEHIRLQLVQRFGRPLCPAKSGPIEGQFVVLALGKLGGRELNYSSDIDLMYLYTGEGQTSGPVTISNKEFSIELAKRLTAMLSLLTSEGSCYRVDLRLRPDGAMGELVLSLDAALRYYHRRSRDWELQMLIKARAVAGSFQLGRTFLSMIEPQIYQTTTDFSTIEQVSESRDRIQEKLRRRGKSGLDIKLARGGIRDIEFLVQCFQRLYGGQDPWVRSGGTLFALHRLRDKGYLSMSDYGRLSSAYQYLRTLEHRLQMEHDRQTHTVPDEAQTQATLASKMKRSVGPDDAGLLRQVELHLKNVTEVYERVVQAQRPIAPVARKPAPEPAEPLPEEDDSALHSWRTQLRHLERHSPGLAQTVASLPIKRGRRHFEHFLNKTISAPALLREFEQHPALLECVGDLIEHSTYLAEELIRHSEDILDLKAVVEAADACSPAGRPARWDEVDLEPRPPFEYSPELQQMLLRQVSVEEKSTWLRQYYRRRMLQIQAESICRRHPIFSTLSETSDLAEGVIRAAYEIAVESVCRSTGRPRPEIPMHIIALGRLGMREFDLASDADLVFALPDQGSAERVWWVQVVERLIEIISSYTREGMIFSIDTRLRPSGRDGELVQTEASFKTYFAERAAAWEAITYMKARAVAGDVRRGTEFLTELQDLGWRRYGLSGELAPLLLGMREKLEKELGHSRPMKAGAGGYYDIDFILMYLRLRDAGIFFESLNTPQRIRVIENTGGLSTRQASVLHDTAVFFRSLDHAIRVATGHSSSKVPNSLAQQQNLAELIGRWSEIKPAAQPLGSLVQEVRQSTRVMFIKIFGAQDRQRRPRTVTEWRAR